MELVFESEGPVLRDRVTKKKVTFDHRTECRFIFNGERVDSHDIPPDLIAFTKFPCRLGVTIKDQYCVEPIFYLLYNPITKDPIYAENAYSFWKLEVNKHSEHYKLTVR